MDYLYVLIIIATAVFLLFSVAAQIRLNVHTDTQVKFFIAAQNFDFNPVKPLAKKAAKYAAVSLVLLLILTGAAAAYFWIKYGMPDLLLTLAVLGIALAAFCINTLILALCASAYVKHKVKYTAVM